MCHLEGSSIYLNSLLCRHYNRITLVRFLDNEFVFFLFFFVDFVKHSRKIRKDSLEKQAVLLIFLLELEIFGVDVQSIHQNSEW